jgi:AGZA family xanthine/uracil permease-like MFS transporter
VTIQLSGILGSLGLAPDAIRGEAARNVEALRLLGNGFILSALIWAAAAAMIIDRRLLTAAAFLAAGSLGSLCGLIHSPLASGGLFWPGGSGSPWPGLLAAGYGLLAGLLVLLAPWGEAAVGAISAERDPGRSQETHA